LTERVLTFEQREKLLGNCHGIKTATTQAHEMITWAYDNPEHDLHKEFDELLAQVMTLEARVHLALGDTNARYNMQRVRDGQEERERLAREEEE
tara:strand:+ start:375 stop:656 length:282 start_codon:yes stop_codon:yes gene_type:complete